MNNIKYIFFDLGSTLVDESECYEKRIRETVSGTGIPYDDFADKVVEFAKQGLKVPHEAAKYYGLPVAKWHTELERLYPGVPAVLSALTEKGYGLGVIANQSLGTKLRLEAWGILKYFDVVVASAEEGVAKPDPEIFIRALSLAECKPENAVMVGDRIDNDIAPANKLGMTTVRVMQGFGRYASPVSLEENADFVIDSIDKIVELF